MSYLLEFKELQKQMMKGGERIAEPEEMSVLRERVKNQLQNEVWEEEQRFENPHLHYMDMTPAYYNEKMQLLEQES